MDRKEIYHNLIESDNLEKVLTQIKENESDWIQKKAILFKSMLSELKNKIDSGIISNDNASIERNKIRIAILNLISNLDRESETEKRSSKEEEGLKIIQNHSGSGDNIIGNKIVNNGTKPFWKWR